MLSARSIFRNNAGNTTLFVLFMSVVLLGCAPSNDNLTAERKTQAERFMRGVYGCSPSVVDELAADSVVMSYPIFAELFDTPALRGKEAVREFAEGFCSRWTEGRLTIHESLADSENAVFIWSFRARFMGPESSAGPVPGEEQGWGGITFFQFDDSGKIASEIGEESTPGPMARVIADRPTG